MSGLFSNLSWRNFFPAQSIPRRANHIKDSRLEAYINPLRSWEPNMVSLQSILIWEKPEKSFLFVIAFNILYWSLVIANFRVFSVISLTALVFHLHNQWVYSIWPEISVSQSTSDQEDWTPVHPGVFSAPELACILQKISAFLDERRIQLILLRKRQPGLFCGILCGFFISTWFIGCYLKGPIIIHLILTTMILGPAFTIHIIPPSFFTWLSHISNVLFGESKSMSDSLDVIDDDLADFLPELKSEETQNALEMPLVINDPTDDTIAEEEIIPKKANLSKALKNQVYNDESSDSSKFLAGLNEEEFPSIGECLEEDSYGGLPDIPEVSKDAPASESNDIHFVHSHFGDSDDEEEFTFMQGLRFRENYSSVSISSPEDLKELALASTGSTGDDPQAFTSATNITNLVSSVATNNAADILTSLGQSLVSSVIGANKEDSSQIKMESLLQESMHSTDDDFEMVSDSDLA